MPKVLRIINRFNLGGPTFNAAYLTRYLEPEFQTLLIGGQKDESEASSEFIVEQLGIKPRILSSMKRNISFMSDYHSYREIKKIIREFNPDIVHTHASKAGAIGRKAAIACRVPVIVHTFHGNVFKGYFGSIKTALYKSAERNLAKKTNAIIAISELQKKELAEEHKICHAEKIHVVPLGFDLSRFYENREEKRKSFRNKYHVKEDEIAVGIIGRLVPIKNHRLFLDSISDVVKKSSKKIRAFIVGDGECMEQLKVYCRQTGLVFSENDILNDSTVCFTSWIREVDEVNAGMDIIALSSDNEGTPVSLIEAQASGKPVVSTRTGGIEDIVLENQTALLSPVGDCTAFSQSLLQLVESDELRAQMGNRGPEFVKDKFHYTRLISDTKSLYNQLLSYHKQ